MSAIRINEQLFSLRKQKNVTQEEVARTLGVTNQSVSKWESGTCCPDIALLPTIATYFNVSIDRLIGYKSDNSFENIYLKIKDLFQNLDASTGFDLAYKLAFILHECAVSNGYKNPLPWDSKIGDENFHKQGASFYSTPSGNSAIKGNSVLFCGNGQMSTISSNDLHKIYKALQKYNNKDHLRVLFALYEMTVNDFDTYVTLDKIANKCKLSINLVEKALVDLPVHTKSLYNSKDGYRIEGNYMHIPAILILMTQ